MTVFSGNEMGVHLLTQVMVASLLAGLAIPAGGLLAQIEHVQSRWIEQELRHSVVAFGGGALLSAVALVLVPEGIRDLPVIPASVCVFAGGVAFMLLDVYLQKIRTSASQLAAMLADFLPESLALGTAFATGSSHAMLLAFLIGLQNLPEGFNAYRELKVSSHWKAGRILLIFGVLSLLGPIAGVSGYLWMSDYPVMTSGIMLFAAGGILYSIFQDIAPQAKLEKHWGPPLGAVLGFIMGMMGLMITR